MLNYELLYNGFWCRNCSRVMGVCSVLGGTFHQPSMCHQTASLGPSLSCSLRLQTRQPCLVDNTLLPTFEREPHSWCIYAYHQLSAGSSVENSSTCVWGGGGEDPHARMMGRGSLLKCCLAVHALCRSGFKSRWCSGLPCWPSLKKACAGGGGALCQNAWSLAQVTGPNIFLLISQDPASPAWLSLHACAVC